MSEPFNAPRPHVTFKSAKHGIRGDTEVMEILVDGRTVAVVYPGASKSIEIVSAHIKSVAEKTNEDKFPPIPSVNIEFDPRPYRIGGGGLIRDPVGGTTNTGNIE